MVKRYQLNNGTRIVAEHLTSVRSVSLGIWILAGSRNEQPHQNGISHLVEHMLFKGTENRDARMIAESFDAIGGHVNAFTSKEFTCFYSKTMDQHADYALDILTDMLFNSLIEEKELEREKKVVEEEISMTEDAPNDIIHDYLQGISFEGHPLAQTILGTEETLSSLTRNDLLDYMRQYYSPERIVVSVAGNIPEELIDRIKELFGSVSKQSGIHDPMKLVYLTNSKTYEREVSQAHLCLGYPGLQIGDEGIYSASVIDNVLGGAMSSRLFQKIREEMGLTYSIFSYHSSFRDNGLFTIYGATNSDQLEQMKDEILKTTNEMKLNGITEKELQNTVQQLKGQLVLGLENPNSRMNRNGRNELLNQPHLSMEELISKLVSVNHEDMNQLMNQMFAEQPSEALIVPSRV
ncbi:peptidase M16 [Halalkalibacillus sediminis]|uniref:Peptidase M16 n=1 Tax=Halalkalibacillus sediminis TaxID=2018042 RepID=A0A2I0QX39_9BACI|nr:pitrilysin family protein [Halalkalibacillus sediminis]PKR78670.1 peptidase M16 [Halalkalibacillus sediminis]